MATSVLILAALLAQISEPELFAETEGWSIARHEQGCLMTREFGGEGNTIVTFAVNPADTTAPLTLLVGNSGWQFPEAEDEGYQVEFSGNAAVWGDLSVHMFTTDDDGDGERDGVISIDFAEDAITSLLEDVAAADGLHLSRQGVTVKRLSFSGSSAAVSSLGRCVGTLP